MACKERCEAIHALHDGELGSFRSLLLKRHLGSCRDCHQMLSELEELSRQLTQRSLESKNPDLWAAIALQLPALDREQSEAAPTNSKFSNWLRPLPAGMAAGFAALCLALGIFWGETPRASVVESIDAQGNPVMVLEDREGSGGTIIWIMESDGETSRRSRHGRP